MKPIRFLPKIQRGQECLNCELPLAGEENFCPNCGQRNDTRNLNFANFLNAVFSEFVSYDSRLWRTIAVLLLKPGQVSRDYIKGRRFRYTNPFRFYLTVSILFFLFLGLVNKYEEIKGTGKSKNFVQFNKDSISGKKKEFLDAASLKLDSIKAANPNIKDLQTLDSVIKEAQFNNKVITDEVAVDSLFLKIGNKGFSKKLAKYNNFFKSHKTLSVEKALDSMAEPSTFWNRFYYSKIRDVYEAFEDGGATLNKKIMSNLSIALFVFLPVFALFIKLLYIRRSLNYMEHLVFVFNTQSVFFILMLLVLGLNLVTESEAWPSIFMVLFLIYLYLALLKFYRQGWFKTFVKFSILNVVYLTLSTIGIIIVSIISFLID